MSSSRTVKVSGGRIAAMLLSITVLAAAAGLSAEEAAPAAQAEEEQPEGKVSLTVSVIEGAQPARDLALNLRLKRRWFGTNSTLTGASQYGTVRLAPSNQEIVTKRNHAVQLKLNRPLSERYYGYGLAGALYDRFQLLDLRVGLGAGLGVELDRAEAWDLKVEAGGAWVQDDVRGSSTLDTDYGLARLAVVYEHRIGASTKLDVSIDYFPAVDDPKDDYLFGFSGVLDIALNKTLSLEFRSTFSHDETEILGTKEDQGTHTLGIAIRF